MPSLSHSASSHSPAPHNAVLTKDGDMRFDYVNLLRVGEQEVSQTTTSAAGDPATALGLSSGVMSLVMLLYRMSSGGCLGSQVRSSSSREPAEPRDSARPQLARSPLSSLLAHARRLDRVPPPGARYLARPPRATILSSHVGSGRATRYVRPPDRHGPQRDPRRDARHVHDAARRGARDVRGGLCRRGRHRGRAQRMAVLLPR